MTFVFTVATVAVGDASDHVTGVGDGGRKRGRGIGPGTRYRCCTKVRPWHVHATVGEIDNSILWVEGDILIIGENCVRAIPEMYIWGGGGGTNNL